MDWVQYNGSILQSIGNVASAGCAAHSDPADSRMQL